MLSSERSWTATSRAVRVRLDSNVVAKLEAGHTTDQETAKEAVHKLVQVHPLKWTSVA